MKKLLAVGILIGLGFLHLWGMNDTVEETAKAEKGPPETEEEREAILATYDARQSEIDIDEDIENCAFGENSGGFLYNIEGLEELQETLPIHLYGLITAELYLLIEELQYAKDFGVGLEGYNIENIEDIVGVIDDSKIETIKIESIPSTGFISKLRLYIEQESGNEGQYYLYHTAFQESEEIKLHSYLSTNPSVEEKGRADVAVAKFLTLINQKDMNKAYEFLDKTYTEDFSQNKNLFESRYDFKEAQSFTILSKAESENITYVETTLINKEEFEPTRGQRFTLYFTKDSFSMADRDLIETINVDEEADTEGINVTMDRMHFGLNDSIAVFTIENQRNEPMEIEKVRLVQDGDPIYMENISAQRTNLFQPGQRSKRVYQAPTVIRPEKLLIYERGKEEPIEIPINL